MEVQIIRSALRSGHFGQLTIFSKWDFRYGQDWQGVCTECQTSQDWVSENLQFERLTIFSKSIFSSWLFLVVGYFRQGSWKQST